MSKDAIPDLLMFAGPNGSGKSTINTSLPPDKIRVYVNADEMEKQIRQQGYLDFSEFGITADHTALRHFLRASTLLQKADLGTAAEQLVLDGSRIYFGAIPVNSYFASVLADFIRHELLAAKQSFTFETVMSSPDKVDFLAKAQAAGFCTHLYYVATEDPLINVERVRNRVAKGGHPVPAKTIISRYHRSLALLPNAIKYTNHASLFDNSGDKAILIAKFSNGQEPLLKNKPTKWFKKFYENDEEMFLDILPQELEIDSNASSQELEDNDKYVSNLFNSLDFSYEIVGILETFYLDTSLQDIPLQGCNSLLAEKIFERIIFSYKAFLQKTLNALIKKGHLKGHLPTEAANQRDNIDNSTEATLEEIFHISEPINKLFGLKEIRITDSHKTRNLSSWEIKRAFFRIDSAVHKIIREIVALEKKSLSYEQ